jgi:hypothetical protein
MARVKLPPDPTHIRRERLPLAWRSPVRYAHELVPWSRTIVTRIEVCLDGY